ncbi:TonB-dependent receptor [Mucilaginibacter hurinus]|uniref:TonB-dependent receptor n=1 Tax=Mucilaginibacter hurinus TaxID=2201324 RepID=A0A367GQP0_9SPHI|nr:TonB-dependent receptor [Mucilaginibacter hurinus]RCH55186.1 TonB-dependent receptor [Mucilaginibacter hurinus]
MRKKILLLQIIMVILPALLFAQNRVITGTIKDIGGVLPGATVTEKGVTPVNATVTDPNGKFKLMLRGSSNVLVVKFVGYSPQEFNVTAGKEANITLQASTQSLDEVLVVGYGNVSRITTTGAVSSISASAIRTVPTANVQNALTGRLPGFFSQQSSGQPGRDASDFFIRGISSLNPDGNRPLIIVDDIEYSYEQLQQINVNEIESISILKDASTTAIYGIKGANGVLVVKTRRGKSGSPKVNLRVEGGSQAPTRVPKFLNSFQSATLINEAYRNDGVPEPYTQKDLELFNNNDDFDGRPNTDWYNKIFRRNSYQANTNIDISGGTTALKYFVSGGALIQNGNVRDFSDPTNLVNTNYYFNRYNFRSNLDLQANKTLNVRLDITTRFSDLNSPRNQEAVAEIYDFNKQSSMSAPFLNPDGSYAYANSIFNKERLPTLNARLASYGYNHERRTDFNVLLNANQDLSSITKGLTLSTKIAYSSIDRFSKGVIRSTLPSFFYDRALDELGQNPYILNPGPSGSYVFGTYSQIGQTDEFATNVNLQLYSTYDRTFAKDHHVTGLILLNQISNTVYVRPFLAPDLVGVPQRFRGISAKATYEYKGKYLFDATVGYNGTDRFAANNRYGYFPAFSVGYRLSEEPFFKKILPGVGLFKLRGSYGLVGSDAAPGNRYVYLQTYSQGGSTNFGETPINYTAIIEGAQSNAFVVWEKSKKANIGLDMNILKDKLSLTLDVFRDIRYDQLITPNGTPQILGVGLPAVNIGRTQNQGFDGQITYNSSIGKVQFNTSFVFSYARNKILFADEASPAFEWLRTTGRPIGQPFGFNSLGYYSPEEVEQVRNYVLDNTTGIPVMGPDPNNPGQQIITGYKSPVPVPSYSLSSATDVIRPGDLKYEDQNGDGVIDNFDKIAIGNPNIPTTNLGLSFGVMYKGFSINVLFQGAFGYSFIVQGNGIEPFKSQFQPIYLQRWTPENAANAQFPRLTSLPTSINSPTSYPSNYWQVNARYIRLKTVDIGYQLPNSLLPFKLNNARIYMSGYNLFTWTNYNKYQQDPEIKTNTAGDAYINARVINLGLQVGF